MAEKGPRIRTLTLRPSEALLARLAAIVECAPVPTTEHAVALMAFEAGLATVEAKLGMAAPSTKKKGSDR